MVICERCGNVVDEFYSTNQESFCLPCVGYFEAVEATEEGKRIRWRYRTSEPKIDIHPVNPSKKGLVQIAEYAKEQKRLRENPLALTDQELKKLGN